MYMYPAAEIRHLAMTQVWDDLAFVHWYYDPQVIQRTLPPGFTVETFDNKAWVGLIPFTIRDSKFPWVPGFKLSFPETNLRTYVIGPDGETGVWFLSLDAGSRLAVRGARATYGLPYYYSQLTVEAQISKFHYWGRRVGVEYTRYSFYIKPLDLIKPEEKTDLDQFLTDRYCLYTRIRRNWHRANIQHEPWPLQRAKISDIDETMIRAYGLPEPPDQKEVVHFSKTLKVHIGWPYRL